MPATVEVHSFHGASGSQTGASVTAVRYKQADNDTVDANNPIPIPTSNLNRSWVKSFRLYVVSGTSPANQIANIKFYTDGNNGLGTGVGLNVKPATTYAGGQNPPVLQDTEMTPSGQYAFAYTSGSPLTISGSINNPNFGYFGDWLISQMPVASQATQGTTPTETLTISYDES